MTSVFISYGHDDGGEFARRLKCDLVDAQFSPVWLDSDMIDPGMNWCAEIEDGLTRADYVLAVMTPGSLRNGSICHNEVAFARSRGRRVIPIRIFNGDLNPSLLLVTLSWLDFSRGYHNSLRQLIRILRGGKDVLIDPAAWAVSQNVIDVGLDIAHHTRRRFTGRRWLFAKVDEWLRKGRRRVSLVLGEPGSGKSAVAAQLALRGDCVAAHFCRYDYPRSLSARDFIANLVASLAAKVPGFADHVMTAHPEKSREDAFTAFRELVVQPAVRCPAPKGPRLIVVDALDESLSADNESILSLLASYCDDLPDWVKIIATSRLGSEVLSLLQSHDTFEICASQPENLEDIAMFVRGCVDGEMAEKVIDNAAGNFLCAARMVEDCSDSLSVENMRHFSPGIGGYLEGTLRRLFPGASDFDDTGRLFLEPLVAARAPLPERVLSKATGLADKEYRVARGRLRGLLAVGPAPDRIVKLFHKALVDWLQEGSFSYGEIDPVEGSRKLVETLRDLPTDDPYRLEWFVTHLVAAGQAHEASEVCVDAEHVSQLIETGRAGILLRDVQAVNRAVPRDDLTSLERLLLREGHLLTPVGPPGSASAALQARCVGSPDLSGLHQALGQIVGSRRFIPVGPMPDHPPRALERVLDGHDRTICAVAWSRDGSRLATGGEDHYIRIWDTKSWQLAHTIRESNVILTMTWCSRGKYLAVAGWGRQVHVWNLRDKRCEATLGEHNGAVSTISWHPGGDLLVTGSWDRRVRLWDLGTGSWQYLGDSFDGKVAAVAWHPQGDTIAVGSGDGTLRVFSGDKLLQQFEVCKLSAGLAALAWNHDGTQLAVSTNDGQVVIWDTTGSEYCCIGQHSAVGVMGIDWGGGSSRLSAGGRDGTVRVWSAGPQRPEVRLARSGGAVNAVAWQPGTDRLASVGIDHRVRIWRTSELGTIDRAEASARELTCMAWHSDNDLLALGGADRAVRFWDPGRGELCMIETTHPLGVKSLCWAPRGDTVVTAGGGLAIETIAYPDGPADRPKADTLSPVYSVASEPWSRLSVTGHGDGIVRVYHEQNLEWEFRACEHRVERLTCSPHGRLLAVQERGDRSIRVYDLAQKKLRRVLGPHQDRVTDVAWDSRGELFFTAGLDRAVRVWDAERGGTVVRPLMHDTPVQAVALHPDSATLVAACADKTLRLWDWRKSEQLAALRLDDGVRAVSFNSKGMLAAAGLSHVYFLRVTGGGLFTLGNSKSD